ncbi:hypothetical protein J1N35_029218, partial [Gossypium stocksii]
MTNAWCGFLQVVFSISTAASDLNSSDIDSFVAFISITMAPTSTPKHAWRK